MRERERKRERERERERERGRERERVPGLPEVCREELHRLWHICSHSGEEESEATSQTPTLVSLHTLHLFHHKHKYVCTRAHTHTHTHTHTHIHTHTHTHTHTHKLTHTNTHTYTHTNSLSHTHTHTLNLEPLTQPSKLFYQKGWVSKIALVEHVSFYCACCHIYGGSCHPVYGRGGCTGGIGMDRELMKLIDFC